MDNTNKEDKNPERIKKHLKILKITIVTTILIIVLLPVSLISLLKLNKVFPNSILLYDIADKTEEVIYKHTGLNFDFNSDGYARFDESYFLNDYHCGMDKILIEQRNREIKETKGGRLPIN